MADQPQGIGGFTVFLESTASDRATGSPDGGDTAESKAASSDGRKPAPQSQPERRPGADDVPSGKFVPPVTNPRVTSGFGPRRDPLNPSSTEMHKGIDFAGKIGDPIYAVADGRVVIAGPVDGFGSHAVYIQHMMNGKTFFSVYGHGSSLNVKRGQQVKAGDRIASVGAEGHVSGPHLHFEVQESINGKRLDPTSMFSASTST